MSENHYKKICYVGSPELFSKGASAIHIMKMCQAIKRSGMYVELVLPEFDQKKDIFQYYGVTEKFPIKTIPFTGSKGRQVIHGIFSAFYAWRNKDRFNFFLTRNIVFTFLATVVFGIRTVYDAHHPLVNSFAYYMFLAFKDSKYLIRFTANSRGLGEIYCGLGLDRDKLVVAHNGVEIEKFEIKDDTTSLRKDLSLDTGRKIICYCGNTYEGRGIEYLIDSAEKLPEVNFLVVGGLENDNERYRKMVRKRGIGNFIIRGHVPHEMVARYLKASDVLVMPYTTGITIKGGTNASGFTSPIKLFEYMAAGKPIVATSLPTITEVVSDGVEALLVDPDSSEAVYDGISTVLRDEDLSSMLSRNAFRKVKEYTWEKRVERITKGL